MITTQFIVRGGAATKGSTVSFMGEKGVITRADCKTLAAWSQAVGWAAKVAGVPLAPRDCQVVVKATFWLKRPQKPRRAPTVRPDVDKLARACLDALTGIAYEDDAQVVELVAAKVYADAAQTLITVETYL